MCRFLVEKERAGLALNAFMSIEKSREEKESSGGPKEVKKEKKGGAKDKDKDKDKEKDGDKAADPELDRKRQRQRAKRIRELMCE